MDGPINLIVTLMVVFWPAVESSLTYSSTQLYLAVLGQNVSLTCRLDSNVEHVVWTYGNEVVTYRRDDSLKGFFKVVQNNTLEIDLIKLQAELIIVHVQYKDAGEYSCEQYFEEGPSKVSKFYLQLQGYPRLSYETKVSTDNDTVVATCCVGFAWKAKEISMIWFQEDVIIRKGIPQLGERKKGFLDFCDHVGILSSRHIFGSVLTCLVDNKYNLSSSVLMYVQYPAKVKMLTETSIEIGKDDELVITCNSDGNPHPQPKLEKEIHTMWSTLPIKPTLFSNLSSNNISWTFVLSNTNESVDGIYRCTSFNGVGKPSFTVNVEVVFKETKKMAPLALLIIPLTIIVAILIIKRDKKNRTNRYEFYLDATRYTRRLTDTLGRLARSYRPFGNRSNLPDVCHNSSIGGGATTAGQIGEIVQSTYMSDEKTSSQKENDNISLSENGKEGPERGSQREEQYSFKTGEFIDDCDRHVYVNSSVWQKHGLLTKENRNICKLSQNDDTLAIDEEEDKPRPASGNNALYATLTKTKNMDQLTTL